MSPSNGIGTAYDGGLPGGGDTNGAATVLLRAKTPISAGPHSLYLSIFDQGDQVLDSAVFLDNLLVGLVGPNLCVPGAGVETEIEMHKTVGTDPDVCAPTDDITVAAGTVVYYCYTVENSGNKTLNLHDLTDTELGPLFTGLDTPLAPGDSVNTVAEGVTASATINATTVNTATWTAYNDGPVDLVRSTDAATVTVETATVVTLASFDAVAQTDHVLITWETVSELNSAGFNLYRSATADGERTLLAFVPSQAPGGTGGAAYSTTDAAVAAGETYWYWLEAVDLSGGSTLYGPVSVTLQTPTAVTLGGLSADAGANRSMLALPVVAALVALPAAFVLRRSTRLS